MYLVVSTHFGNGGIGHHALLPILYGDQSSIQGNVTSDLHPVLSEAFVMKFLFKANQKEFQIIRGNQCP